MYLGIFSPINKMLLKSNVKQFTYALMIDNLEKFSPQKFFSYLVLKTRRMPGFLKSLLRRRQYALVTCNTPETLYLVSTYKYCAVTIRYSIVIQQIFMKKGIF